jgi:integrase
MKRYRGKKLTSKSKDWDKGTWYIWKRLGKKIIHKAIPEAQTKTEAEQAERSIIKNAFNKRYGAHSDTSFTEFAEGPYTRYYEGHNVNVGAKRLYIETLVKAFKGKYLADITPQDCRDVRSKLQKSTSASSVNRIMSTASRLFSLACEEGILDRNPMQYVKSLKEPPKRKRLLTIREKEKLWQELRKDELMSRLVTLALNLPLRRGQLLAITPVAVDLENGLLLAESSKGRPSRAIPLNSTASDTLRLMLDDGTLPFPIKDFRRRWKPLLIAAGINKKDGKRGENYTFHDLRKEFATELMRRNQNSKTIQHLFAHSDMSITDIYIQEDFEQMRDAVNTLDATNLQPTQNIEGPPN